MESEAWPDLHGQKQIKESKSCKNSLKVVTIFEPKANKKN